MLWTFTVKTTKTYFLHYDIWGSRYKLHYTQYCTRMFAHIYATIPSLFFNKHTPFLNEQYFLFQKLNRFKPIYRCGRYCTISYLCKSLGITKFRKVSNVTLYLFWLFYRKTLMVLPKSVNSWNKKYC